MIQHALKYAAAGIAVFPIAARDKVPAIPKHEGGNGCLDATTDDAIVSAWWRNLPDSNIGIATGPVSSLLVVDLDGPEGAESWEHVCAGHTLATARVQTSNGTHLYFRSALTIGNTAKRLGPGIDTRGKGGYVVAPPSIHPSGKQYAWSGKERVEQLPAWLEALLNPPPRPPQHLPSPLAGTVEDAYGRAALERILEDLRASGEGTRNDALNRAAYQCGRLIAAGRLTSAVAEDLEHTALSIGLDGHEVAATIASGLCAGADNPAKPRPLNLDTPRLPRAPRIQVPRL